MRVNHDWSVLATLTLKNCPMGLSILTPERKKGGKACILRFHKPSVTGSNPDVVTKKTPAMHSLGGGLLFITEHRNPVSFRNRVSRFFLRSKARKQSQNPSPSVAQKYL